MATKFIKVTEVEERGIVRRELGIKEEVEVVPLRGLILSVDKIVYFYEYKENNIKYTVIITDVNRICVKESVEELQEKLKAVE